MRAGAKYADALRKISLACFSSRTSRSKAFIFSACSVVMPPRWPVSTSTFLTHSFSVCGAQPIFDEIDTIAAQRLSCCPAPSNTIRTARSRTSGEYLFVVFVMMLHPTHELEPPANPARFSPLGEPSLSAICLSRNKNAAKDAPRMRLPVSISERTVSA